MQYLKITAPEQYYQLLVNQSNCSNLPGKNLIDDEWENLLFLLTTGETYFFRDRGQLALLRNRILPKLVECKKAHSLGDKTKPTLRFWSAGCSTGEEVYSLAILVKQLIPDWQQWEIFILGTDINPESIAKAKRGIYQSSSFRMIDPVLKAQYFSQHKQGWKINEQIRRMVTFHHSNLIKDCFPSKNSLIHNMDVIICRNVFIYFDFAAIASVLKKFYNTLKPQGYLITRHTELQGQDIGQLQTKVFPESIVYQRNEENPNSGNAAKTTNIAFKQSVSAQRSLAIENSSKQSSSPNSTSHKNLTVPAPISKHSFKQTNYSILSSSSTANQLNETKPEIVFSQAQALYNNGEYTSAIKVADQLIKQYPNYFDAYYLIAESFANLGDYQQAIHYCYQGIKVDELSVKPYYLLAHIAAEQGNTEEKKKLFKQILDLAPKSVTAYLELGCVYEQEGDTIKAEKMLINALGLLKELPYNAAIEHSNGITAGNLISQLKKYLITIKT